MRGRLRDETKKSIFLPFLPTLSSLQTAEMSVSKRTKIILKRNFKASDARKSVKERGELF